MKFFYADSLDLVDPGFDFVTEKSPEGRVPQRDDVYAHELFGMERRPYDGLLVSKALFRAGGGSTASGKYTQPQRQRFLRRGAQTFLRFPKSGDFDSETFPILGDNGAFTYRNEFEPPYTIEELIEFYDVGGFTHGISLDHMVMEYDKNLDGPALPGIDLVAEPRRRQQLTLENARLFLAECEASGVDFTPLGSAQGWSPESYGESVRTLVKMGYDYIAVGGLVPLKTPEVLEVLAGIRAETGGRVALHLLGVTRLGQFNDFRDAGVVSFDSSSPLRQAFKDAKNNYYSHDRHGHYTAVRVPQSDGNRVLRRIREGVIEQAAAMALERRCLEALRLYGRGQGTASEVLDLVRDYAELTGAGADWTAIKRTLVDRPWDHCPCSVCVQLGIDVVVFRGANRNRRRGFHNLWWTHQQLQQQRKVEAA